MTAAFVACRSLVARGDDASSARRRSAATAASGAFPDDGQSGVDLTAVRGNLDGQGPPRLCSDTRKLHIIIIHVEALLPPRIEQAFRSGYKLAATSLS
jgi:hypothetical protein